MKAMVVEKYKDFAIPAGVKEIIPYAHENDTSLGTVRIPVSVMKIGEGAFDGCTNLENIFVNADNPYYADEWGVLYSKDKTRLIRVPEGHHGELVLEQPLAVIEDGAFKGDLCLNIILCREELYPLLAKALSTYEGENKVNIFDDSGILMDPEKTFIGPAIHPVYGSYTVPESVEHIEPIYSIAGNEDCPEFTDIFIHAGVTEIDEGAFEQCPNLTIHAPAGSYAARYAEENGIPYIAE